MENMWSVVLLSCVVLLAEANWGWWTWDDVTDIRLCTRAGVWHMPLDGINGEGRTSSTWQECQARCKRTPGCNYFNSFPDGGCHITDGRLGTQLEPSNPTAMAGGKNCKGDREPIAAGCYTIRDRAECCKYFDGRSNYYGHDCMPSHGVYRFKNVNVCEPAHTELANHGYDLWYHADLDLCTPSEFGAVPWSYEWVQQPSTQCGSNQDENDIAEIEGIVEHTPDRFDNSHLHMWYYDTQDFQQCGQYTLGQCKAFCEAIPQCRGIEVGHNSSDDSVVDKCCLMYSGTYGGSWTGSCWYFTVDDVKPPLYCNNGKRDTVNGWDVWYTEEGTDCGGECPRCADGVYNDGRECGKNANNCCNGKDGMWDEWWSEMSSVVQELWTKFGWDQNKWDSSYYWNEETAWAYLTSEQQSAAQMMCFDQTRWDTEVLNNRRLEVDEAVTVELVTDELVTDEPPADELPAPAL